MRSTLDVGANGIHQESHDNEIAESLERRVYNSATISRCS